MTLGIPQQKVNTRPEAFFLNRKFILKWARELRM